MRSKVRLHTHFSKNKVKAEVQMRFGFLWTHIAIFLGFWECSWDNH